MKYQPPGWVARHLSPLVRVMRETWAPVIFAARALLGSVIPDEHGRPFAPKSLGKLKLRPCARGERRKAIEARRRSGKWPPNKRGPRVAYRRRDGISNQLHVLLVLVACMDRATGEVWDPDTVHLPPHLRLFLSVARLTELCGFSLSQRVRRCAGGGTYVAYEGADKVERALGQLRAARAIDDVIEFRRERRDENGKQIKDAAGRVLYESTGPACRVMSFPFLNAQGGLVAYTLEKERTRKSGGRVERKRNRFTKWQASQEENAKAAFKQQVEAQHAPAPEDPLPPAPDPIAPLIAEVEADHPEWKTAGDFARVRAEAKNRARLRQPVDTS